MFAHRIKQIRKQKRMTQEEFAPVIKVTRSTLANYERGKFSPSFTKMQEIADCLGMSIDQLDPFDDKGGMSEVARRFADKFEAAPQHLQDKIMYQLLKWELESSDPPR